jgi:glycosyltransferase involved in cell wall biosynthesis
MRLAPRKRPLHLLKMIRRVREQLPAGRTIEVVIIGEGPERASLETYMERHDLTGVVRLVGRLTRDEIREQFAQADVFVAPANLESFGIAALEARCAGLPVVAKARTGIREFVANGQEGLLAQSDRDMVTQLLRLIRDPELRQTIAAHNRAVPSRVDWHEVVGMNEATYLRAIALMGTRRADAATG